MTTPAPLGVRGTLRAVVRQLAAAVYAYVAYALLVSWLRPESPWTVLGLRLVLIFAAGAALSALVQGPLWTVAFVGAFAAAFDLILALLGTDVDAGLSVLADPQLLAFAALTLLAGLAGAALVRRLRRPPAPSSTA